MVSDSLCLTSFINIEFQVSLVVVGSGSAGDDVRYDRESWLQRQHGGPLGGPGPMVQALVY